MAHMIINIEMDNAAFDECESAEISRILHELADRMECGISPVTIIRDHNGNRIGQAEHYEESE